MVFLNREHILHAYVVPKGIRLVHKPFMHRKAVPKSKRVVHYYNNVLIWIKSSKSQVVMDLGNAS